MEVCQEAMGPSWTMGRFDANRRVGDHARVMGSCDAVGGRDADMIRDKNLSWGMPMAASSGYEEG